MRSAPPAPASAITYTSGFAGWLRCWAENARRIGSILPGLSSRSPGSGRLRAKPIASLFGCDAQYLTVHAGLEVGFFSEKKPELDAISIGPDCWNFHSPSEEMSISSVRRVYRLLCNILARCR